MLGAPRRLLRQRQWQLARSAVPALRQQQAPATPPQLGKRFVTYAENPAKWQTDPAVMMYGQLLAVRDTQQEAFLVAADTLRGSENLPRDLRASASRARATVLFQKAISDLNGFQAELSFDKPFPTELFDKTVEAAGVAAKAYGEAVEESSDKSLRAEVEPHCPEWPEVIAAITNAYNEVLKLRAEVQFRQVSWYSRQAEHARVLRDAARPGGNVSSDAASEAMDALGLAGFDATTEEMPLLEAVVKACDSIVEGCYDKYSETPGSDPALKALRSRAQALLALSSKDLAVAQAMSHQLSSAVESTVRALKVRPEDPSLLTKEGAEQVRAAAQGVFELCGREMRGAETQKRAEEASLWAARVAEALAMFDGWQKSLK